MDCFVFTDLLYGYLNTGIHIHICYTLIFTFLSNYTWHHHFLDENFFPDLLTFKEFILFHFLSNWFTLLKFFLISISIPFILFYYPFLRFFYPFIQLYFPFLDLTFLSFHIIQFFFLSSSFLFLSYFSILRSWFPFLSSIFKFGLSVCYGVCLFVCIQ